MYVEGKSCKRNHWEGFFSGMLIYFTAGVQ